ncbi:DUF1707 SHOCT-like domain-containing protein [Gordonia hydrophobica]|uniref:DUF1707 domain-containing protein n=1 Tax=Gordonia hydrophobica TaxID=40516 RepID=A0ABZ2U0B7_9ACTN|nr:DUF1707 domain-containing protein [Gordonia hydrophobica]MBM7366286.1 hypothetical protein [Gordonia hydrophobica]
MSAEHPDDDVRVGHPERERAIGLINDSFSQGYLDITEFEQRSGVVYEARTRGDLRGVVADLPNAQTLFPDAPVVGAAASVDLTPETIAAEWDTHRRKGSWTVPAKMILTGQMGTFEIDYRLATFTAPSVELQLQVTASTVRVRLGSDQEIRYQSVVKTGWSSIKDKAGAPERPGGQVITVTGSIGGMTGMTIKRS